MSQFCKLFKMGHFFVTFALFWTRWQAITTDFYISEKQTQLNLSLARTGRGNPRSIFSTNREQAKVQTFLHGSAKQIHFLASRVRKSDRLTLARHRQRQAFFVLREREKIKKTQNPHASNPNPYAISLPCTKTELWLKLLAAFKESLVHWEKIEPILKKRHLEIIIL